MIPGLLVVEDNKSLLEDIIFVANQGNWTTREARCVEYALAILETESSLLHALLLDIMVPNTHAACDKLDTLLKERTEMVLAATQSGRAASLPANHLVQARAALDVIDSKIRSVINPNGAVDFLREATRRRLAIPKQIVIFTARDPTSSDIVREIESSLNQTHMLHWLHKPVPPIELEDLLRRLHVAVLSKTT